MKNIIIIDIDTERDQVIQIKKPSEFSPPTSPEEAKQIILTDMSCVCEALKKMIHISSDSGYATEEVLIKKVHEHLTGVVGETEEKNTEEKDGEG